MSEVTHPLTLKAEAAFRKAMENVIRTARQTGTPIIVWENGRVRELSPDEVDLTKLAQPPSDA
jgi:hypothetical protein